MLTSNASKMVAFEICQNYRYDIQAVLVFWANRAQNSLTTIIWFESQRKARILNYVWRTEMQRGAYLPSGVVDGKAVPPNSSLRHPWQPSCSFSNRLCLVADSHISCVHFEGAAIACPAATETWVVESLFQNDIAR